MAVEPLGSSSADCQFALFENDGTTSAPTALATARSVTIPVRFVPARSQAATWALQWYPPAT